jgi:hypothetical protein
MTGLDNGLGLGIGSTQSLDQATDYRNNTMIMKNSRVYGESDIPDCP